MAALRALVVQLLSAFISAVIGLAVARSGLYSPGLLQLALLQGLLAAVLAWRQGADRWWLPLHFCFWPAVVVLQSPSIPPAWYLSALVLLLLIFGLPFRTRVPLFLSSRLAVDRFAAWLPRQPLTILDVGSGTGRFVIKLARQRRDCQITGVELALLPWWISRLAARRLDNAQLQRVDLWSLPLDHYDVVYAFLSPPPMPALWNKAQREMRSGSWLVSNSFQVPDLQPTETIEVDDSRRTKLYCYRIP
jgi:SAM-dependent methyltransferase